MSEELIKIFQERVPIYWGKSDDLCLSVPDRDKIWEPRKQEWEPLKYSDERRRAATNDPDKTPFGSSDRSADW